MHVLRGSAHAGCPVVGRTGNTTRRTICVPSGASDNAKTWSLRTSCQQRHPLTLNARGRYPVATCALFDASRVTCNTSTCFRRIADVRTAASSAVMQNTAVSAEISEVRGRSYFVLSIDKQRFKEQG